MLMKQEIADICERYGVLDLYVFGSRAREVVSLVEGRISNLEQPEPDVDIGILPADKETWTPEKKVEFSIELEDRFQVHRVDLILLPEADAFLALDIIRGELLYCADLDDQARYELFVLRRAGDLLPFQKARTRMILKEGGR